MKALIVNLNLAVDKTVKIPVFRQGRIYRFTDAITQAGGKGVNVARALRELGCGPLVAGFVSGHNGRRIEEYLRTEGLPALLVRHAAGESRLCYSVIDGKGVSTDFNEEGPAVPAAAQARFLVKISRTASAFGVAAVCGRASAGIRKGFYVRLAAALRRAGCFTAFDTSGAPLLEGLEGGADMVKINRGEFEELSGGAFSPRGLRRFFREHSPAGLKALVVTDGARPTLAASQFGLWEVTPPPLKRVENAVGAGDSFMAGFLCGFLKGLAFEENLRLASGCAASDCLTLGSGLISRRAAEAFSNRVRVREL